MSRSRRWIYASSLVATLAFTAACAPPGSSPDTGGGGEGAQETGPIKVGVLAPLTGGLAGPGKDQRDGFLLYLEEHGNKLGGRDVEVVVEDDQGNPEAGIQAATRLVEREQVDLVVGPLLGNVGLAVGDYMGTTDTTLFYPIPSSEAFLRKKPETMFLAGGTAAQDAHPLGAYAAEQGKKRVLTICSDYAFGHELCGGFVNTFTDHGGTVVNQLWPPLGTVDFGPFVSQIVGDFDVIYSGVVGADSIKFVQAYRDFGLDDKAPLLTSLQPLDESLVPAMGDAALGLQSSGHWVEGRDDPDTKAFVDAYEKKFQKIPGYYSASGFLAGQWIDGALGKSGGQVGTPEQFLEVLGQVDLSKTIFGKVTLDDQNNVVWPEYLRVVEKRADGKVWNVVAEDLGEAGPTWDYDFEAYTSQPTYTRDYQGVDWPKDCAAYTADCPLR